MSGPNVISELEREWVQLRVDPETVRIFEGLQGAEPVLAALKGLDGLVAVMAARACVADLDRHDEVLLALLRQARVRSRMGIWRQGDVAAVAAGVEGPVLRWVCGRDADG